MERSLRVSDGAELFFEDTGSGTPLLLLHGLTGTHRDFEHVFELERLRTQRRVIAPDARAHGNSTDPHAAFSLERCAEDVIELLDQLGLERVQAVGASLGAKTLLLVATHQPARLAEMVLVSATPRFPEATRAIFKAAAQAPHSAEEWTAMRAQHRQGDAQIGALWRIPARLADSADLDLSTAELASIRAKTLIVSGDRDPLYPIELAVELYRGIPGSALFVVPEGGHLPIFGDERTTFATRALRWLDTGS